ncbi:hypothetical protein KP509_06G054800 [Ceratopteris richardii]|uniref:Helicase ATP-binding domain-containing protein n=1 Tax=Ceratopteris richardii TaxID=49495 RepID=A0A8T2UIB4_CERRI|nr:hypothetical protein KP509_06G054800 [Ceratopteris richardii]
MTSAKSSQALVRRVAMQLWARSMSIHGAKTACTDMALSAPSSKNSTENHFCVPASRRVISCSTNPHSRRLGRCRQSLHSWASHQSSTSPVFAEDSFESDEHAQKHPSHSAADDGIEISKLPILPVLVNGLAKRGITTLFPIQKALLEPTLKGQDLIAQAKTRTGKTLAFGIPILDKIIKVNEAQRRGYGRAPLDIILAPTRELAKQVETELKESAPSLEIVCVYGGVSIDNQVRQVQRGVDMVVGTSGHIIDLLDRGALNLRKVQHFVLDEADRMLAVGFEEAVEKILQHLPP